VRILQVVQELQRGGAERVVVSLARAARDAGHEVAVAAAYGPLADELEAEQFELPFVRRSLLGAARAALRLRRTFRAWSPDVVHAHNPTMAVASRLASPRGLRGLVTMHGVPEEDYGAAVRAFRFARLPVVACGPGVAAALAARGLAPRATIVNGVSTPPEPDRQELERLAGRDRPVVLNVGRLVSQKNQRLAIRALALVPDAALVVVGTGPLHGELLREAQAAGVVERVAFAGAREDARRLLGAADALVVTSRWEGLPLVALEALAAGVPVVATAVRGVTELLDDGTNALLARPDDASNVATALRRVLGDPALTTRLAEAGRILVQSHTEAAMTRRYLELYEQV
jgi:glycosyltransferase involved in cell wall biosynthesis